MKWLVACRPNVSRRNGCLSYLLWSRGTSFFHELERKRGFTVATNALAPCCSLAAWRSTGPMSFTAAGVLGAFLSLTGSAR